MINNAGLSMYAPVLIYGPPGAGKSTLGQALAQALHTPFTDLDSEIEARSGLAIPQIFSQQGEVGFRHLEAQVLETLLDGQERVIALGGGALLDPRLRARAEAAGIVLCLRAPAPVLQARLKSASVTRPLLAGDLSAHLSNLLAERAGHYASFPWQLDVGANSVEELTWQVQAALGRFYLRGMQKPGFPGCEVRIRSGSLDELGQCLSVAGLGGPVLVVSDSNVTPLYAPQVLANLRSAGYDANLVEIPAGEKFKTLETIERLWASSLDAGLDRTSTILALGGGVVGDLAGFAAASYLRGISWVCVPTTLLSMVDASLGGKTGADLPQGKNLIGAFYPPRLVLVDPDTLATLPLEELRSGMAEVVKHALISDPQLFAHCKLGWKVISADWDWLVRRAMAVKIGIIEADPYERGLREVLNLGHTLGHAVERAADYSLRHGEAVAIGILAAARLSERLGIAQADLTSQVEDSLSKLGLPMNIPAHLEDKMLLQYMGVDKKRANGKLRFVLPVRIGKVLHGIEVDEPGMILEEGR